MLFRGSPSIEFWYATAAWQPFSVSELGELEDSIMAGEWCEASNPLFLTVFGNSESGPRICSLNSACWKMGSASQAVGSSSANTSSACLAAQRRR